MKVFITILIFFSFNLGILNAESKFNFYPKMETQFPIFSGIGFGITLNKKIHASFSYGFAPEFYYNTIARVSAELGGNSYYEDVINAAFSNNKIAKASIGFSIEEYGKGWSFDFSYLQLNSSGKADIDKVLGATTGQDYSQLKNLLVLAGRSEKVDMEGGLTAIGLSADYGIQFNERWNLIGSLGVVKVLSAQIDISTGFPVFEASAFGSQLIRQSEKDLEEVVVENAISPFVGVTLFRYL